MKVITYYCDFCGKICETKHEISILKKRIIRVEDKTYQICDKCYYKTLMAIEQLKKGDVK